MSVGMDNVESFELHAKQAFVDGEPVFALTPHKELSDAQDTGKVIVAKEPVEVRK